MSESPSTDEPRDDAEDPPIWAVGYDGSDHSANGLRWAINRAAERHAALDIVSAYMYPHTDRIPPDSPFSAEEIYGSSGVACRRRAQIGPAADVLIDASIDSELLVTGSRGRGAMSSLLLGSVTHDLVVHLHTPTVIVPEAHDPRPPVRRLVLGVNRSKASRAALLWAAGFADDDAEIVAVHAHSEHDDEREDVDTLVGAVEDEIGRAGRFSRTYPTSTPGRALLDEAAGADLIVVGNARKPGLATELDSTALWLLQHLELPLAVVPRPSATRT